MEVIEQTPREQKLLDSVMSGKSLYKAGKEAGFSTPSRDAANLFFDKRAQRYAFAKTKGKFIIQGSPVAYDLMYRTMTNETADLRLRLRCAEMILTMGGHVGAKAADNELLSDEAKEVKDMTLREVDSFLNRIAAERKRRAENATIIDVTPEPQAQGIESMF